MNGTELVFSLLIAALIIFVIVVLARSVKIVPQQMAYIVERLGKYARTLTPGLSLLVPFIDSVRAKVDLREQVVSFPPQPVITSDNLVVNIDTVLYYVVTDPKDATYAIENYLAGVEQLTVTTLRNVVGSLDMEKALTSREDINRVLRGVLDEATGKWGLKVTRVEIKAIEPPPSIRDAMEKQMRAERDRRAKILEAEGIKASDILRAEGYQQSAVLRANGERQARVLTAEGESKAIETVFAAIHRSKPSEKLLAYQYLQKLPEIASGSANKVWVIPAELTRALESFGGALGQMGAGGSDEELPPEDIAQPDTDAIADARAAAEAAATAAKGLVDEVDETARGSGKVEVKGQGADQAAIERGEQVSPDDYTGGLSGESTLDPSHATSMRSKQE